MGASLDLISVSIQGWRRFADETKIQTNGKLVSILGPNEAGKSSLLQAIRQLRDSADISLSDISRDTDANNFLIEGRFHLSEDELVGAGLGRPTRVILKKRKTGPVVFSLEPPAPKREVKTRSNTVAHVTRVLGNEKFVETVNPSLAEKLHTLLELMKSTEETIPESTIAEINECAALLKESDLGKLPKYVNELGSALISLAVLESDDTPSNKAISFLLPLLPSILLFGQEERDLKQEYDIDELSTAVPRALSNLASVANLDIDALRAAIDRNDPAAIETIKAKSNKILRDRFQEVWSQSGVHASISVKDRTLNILVENNDNQFTALAERSDGLRQFVALQSFTMKERSIKPILLIDEAEIHLHYDAQADLVQMLSRQQVASKVIYTTHSAGCLPEDLGNGVRLVQKIDEAESKSKVINRFWGGR